MHLRKQEEVLLYTYTRVHIKYVTYVHYRVMDTGFITTLAFHSSFHQSTYIQPCLDFSCSFVRMSRSALYLVELSAEVVTFDQLCLPSVSLLGWVVRRL